MRSPAAALKAAGAAPRRLALEGVAASSDRHRCQKKTWSIDNGCAPSSVHSEQSGCSARGSTRGGAEETPERLVARLHDHVRHSARLQSALNVMAAERDCCTLLLTRELQRSDAQLAQARHAAQTLWSARRVLVDEVVKLRERVATLERAAAYRPPPAEAPPRALLSTHLSLAAALDGVAAAFPAAGSPNASPIRNKRAPLSHPSANASPVRPPGLQVPSSTASLRSSPAALPPRSSPYASIDLEGLLDSELALADHRLRRLLSSASKESPKRG